MSNSGAKTPISYKVDFDTLAEHESRKYKVADGGTTAEYPVAFAKDVSIEFFIREVADKLSIVSRAGGAAWNGVKLFTELGRCCKNRFLQAFNKAVAADYSANNLKTVANFAKLKKDMITDVYGFPNPGNLLKTYMMTKIKYILCFNQMTGQRERPTDFLARLQEMIKCGEQMHHSMAGDLFTEDEFKLVFWNSFPDEMKN